ncbi:DNA repair protein RecN [Haloflavibacter putidus]|uniref:DNA repair protein RecN n=1 Tax=Haloflavibacter putidus TaxID=2576776 RepID=A0A508A0J4_9FLAO|nr:DNA repair protein RecN [Haloflavibacter putidus]TQD39352.1 DNA repair protein RecN [Haloflavibacter putidus]
MLTSLSIKNFALIEDVQLSLQDKFTTITGETGAGKSILLGALSLLLGKRADLNAIRNSEKKCIIEGIFTIADYKLEGFFAKQDLDYDKQSIIRREILPSGKSRAFINDTPVKLQVLTRLGQNLVDIHSQHETLFVGDANYQYRIIDSLANNQSLLATYKEALQNYENLQHRLKKHQLEQQQAAATYDYNLYLMRELQEAELAEGMQEELEQQQNELSNVEALKENLMAAAHLLEQDDVGVTEVLKEVNQRLGSIENFGDTYKNFKERLQSVLLELEDLTMEIANQQENVEADPASLEQVNEKLRKLYALQKKHGITSEKELLDLQKELEEKIDASENSDAVVEELQKEIVRAKQEALGLAKELHQKRQQQTKTFIQQVENILAQVGMPDARLKIIIEFTEKLGKNGADTMQWQLAANKGGKYAELKKAASGGELSRITLAIKSILAKYSSLPTLIFDEIDTGVSGDIAQKMGDIMRTMGENLQVVAITHLPQIAAKGQQQLKVFKETKQNTTVTNIVNLNQESRINELAEMLGGKEKPASAVAHAKALLN